jgi:antitoxin VapB
MVDIQGGSMKTATLFTNGRSQAVRLPKECRFAGKEVFVRKFENVVILFPKRAPWTPLVSSLSKFSPDFMEERPQPGQSARAAI